MTICKGPYTINAACHVGSTRDMVSKKKKCIKTLDCKAVMRKNTVRETNMTRTDKAESQQWIAVSPFLGLVNTV